ncbi:MAG TPA: hypothetical protein VMW40_02960 [Candidatus Bathyarchaeia archaeon]|nr:hypothetical protein [Candidatus Bathyarchaeia archaeon]
MTLMKRDAAEVLRQFESVKSQAKQLRQSIRDSLSGPVEELKSLVEAYKDAKLHFGGIASEQNINVYLRDIEIKGSDYSAVYKQKALLSEIDVECDKAIDILGNMAAPLTEDDFERLAAFREQLETLSEVLPDINYEINVNEALNEYERGAYLASALISGRVILYTLNQIRGESAEKKVQFLREKGIIEKGGKEVYESILNADRKARNLFSFDLSVFPSSSDALLLLGDAIEILEIVSNVLNAEKKSFEK